MSITPTLAANLKKFAAGFSMAGLLGLLVAGCEFDNGISVRAKEKPEVYASLHVWQKRFIEKGVIAQGFTSDMVYIAMGNPSKVETRELPQGRTEVWTYSRYYPNVTGAHGSTFNGADYNTDSGFQGQFNATQDDPNLSPDPHSNQNPQIPVGMSKNLPSLFKAGPPQGGSMEPADIRSYTFVILFKDGKVAKFGSYPNAN